ncbi:hypothetical protein BC832DRAFT_424951 [Gaertneriomyces semiglobifer]|nr:hypothetical protein BC832DRAFT_424951 [Gaertneriomyces semiglobifer]
MSLEQPLIFPSSHPTSLQDTDISASSHDRTEEALTLLRDLLSSISSNAAQGDFHSASLSLAYLGLPPNHIDHPTHHDHSTPIQLLVMKMRAARLSREHRRQPSRPSVHHHHIPEVYQVSIKTPRSLHEQAILHLWDQARLKRWWDWHDSQMALLKEEKLQKQRRRQFLMNLRQHPWVHPTDDERRSSDEVEEVKRRKMRAQFLTKLRTSGLQKQTSQTQPGAENATSPSSPTSPDAILQRQSSIKRLRSRTPRSPCARQFEFAPLPEVPEIRIKSPEEYRRHLTGEHSGDLRQPETDFWQKWEAGQTLVEKREEIRDWVDGQLSSNPIMPTHTTASMDVVQETTAGDVAPMNLLSDVQVVASAIDENESDAIDLSPLSEAPKHMDSIKLKLSLQPSPARPSFQLSVSERKQRQTLRRLVSKRRWLEDDVAW